MRHFSFSFVRARLPQTFAIAATAFVAACAVPEEAPPPVEEVGTSTQAVTADDAIARAEEWVAAKLLYCQAANGAPDADASCSATCNRKHNTEWDPYRSDCSGLVSWAWGLPAPGRTTAEFAPNQSDITKVIDASTLQPGDAVNTDDSLSNEHHVMLFKKWTVNGKTATFIEEPGCAANPDYAHEFTSDVTLNGTSITVTYNGITFKRAIRYREPLTASPPSRVKRTASPGNASTRRFADTMPGYAATPGLCPGPADEQCCTPPASMSTSGSTSAVSSGITTSGASGSSTTAATIERCRRWWGGRGWREERQRHALKQQLLGESERLEHGPPRARAVRRPRASPAPRASLSPTANRAAEPCRPSSSRIGAKRSR